MKKERLRVLIMLEEGKISVDEAARLLEALASSRSVYGYDDDEDIEKKINAFSKSVDNFAREFGSKIGGAYKDMEPKLRNVTKAVVEKTANIADDISKSLHESLKNMQESEYACKDDCGSDTPDDDTPREN